MEDRIRKVFLSIFSILIGGIFVLDGITKLLGVTMPYEVIPIRDYPMWLGNVVSIFELVGGLLLLIEDSRFYGSILAVISTIVGIIYGVAAPQLSHAGASGGVLPGYLDHRLDSNAGTIA